MQMGGGASSEKIGRKESLITANISKSADDNGT